MIGDEIRCRSIPEDLVSEKRRRILRRKLCQSKKSYIALKIIDSIWMGVLVSERHESMMYIFKVEWLKSDQKQKFQFSS